MIPKCYYHKDILKLIDYQIEDGFTDFESIEDIDKDSLSAACIRALGNDAFEIFNADYFEDSLCKLTQFMIMGSHSNAYELAESMRENSIIYFTPILNEIFHERHEQSEFRKNRESGMKPTQHRDNGEIQWI